MSGSQPKLFHRKELQYDPDTDDDFLGAGAFGEVFRCQLVSTNEVAAVKVLNTPSRLNKSQQSAFMNEVSFLHQLTACPYVIRLLGLCMDRGYYAIVMEFVENGDLEDLLTNSTKREQHPIIKEWACRIGMGLEVARGMDFLHRQQPPIIHRDLKSANVLIDEQYRCKIIDFGLATTRSISKQSERSRSYRNPVGTLAFTAPELFRGDFSQAKLDKTDVYSYSILLWQLKEMKQPFEDEIRTDVVRANIIAGCRPTLLSNDGSPEGLTNLITRCWDSHPDVRLSFEEILCLLERMSMPIARGRTITGRKTPSRFLSNNNGNRRYTSDQQQSKSVSSYSDSPKLKLDFHNAFIGNNRPTYTSEESLFTVELDELTPDKVAQLYDDCQGSGFASALKPYLIDLLKRKETFQTVRDMFKSAYILQENGAETSLMTALPRFLLAVTPKDVFVSLLEVTLRSAHGRLVSFYASLRCPIPLVYTVQPSVEETKTVTNFHALHDVLAVPSYPLVLSCGTEEAVGRGKSTLTESLVGLLQLGFKGLNGFSFSDNSFIWQTSGRGGPTHSPSIDLAFEVRSDLENGLNVADVHGFTLEKEFCNAMSTLCSVAALVLIHVTARDFNSNGQAGEGLISLLTECWSLNHFEAEVVFLVRDVASSSGMDELLLSVEASLAQLLPDKVAAIVPVENLDACRTDTEKKTALHAIGDHLLPILRRLKGKMPCFEVISELFASIVSGPVTYKRQLIDTKDGFSKLGRQVWEVLDRSKLAHEQLADHIFPLTTVYTEIARIRQREKEIHESQRGLSKQDYRELFALSDKWKKLEHRRVTCQVSKAVQLFVSLIKNKSCDQIDEFQRYLEKWQAQHSNAVQDKRINVSIDSFWNELMELCDLQEDDMVDCTPLLNSCDVDSTLVKGVYVQCVIEGYPMELLRGHPLQMTASKFRKDVCTQLDMQMENKLELVVVSLVGAPNSAKSSLLNYLFGCRFTTREERFTEGLYAAYATDSDGRRLLVMDFQGLFSSEREEGEVDRHIAGIALACSDVVVVNHKGEIPQVNKLLEVCFCNMDSLIQLHVGSRPELAFIFRDQQDRKARARRYHAVLPKLKDTVLTKLVGKLVTLKNEAIFLLPSALSEEAIQGGCTIQCSSPDFSKETFPLRKQLLGLLEKPHSEVTSSSFQGKRLVDWYTRACLVWDTSINYGLTQSSCWTLFTEIYNVKVSDAVQEAVKDIAFVVSNVVKEHTSALRAAGDKTTVNACDSRCRTELDSLKEKREDVVPQIFKDISDDMMCRVIERKYIVQLESAIGLVYEFHLSSWQEQLKVVSNRLDREASDRHVVSKLDEVLRSRESQAGLSRAEAMERFETLWMEYENECVRRLESKKQTYKDIDTEVWKIFFTSLYIQQRTVDVLRLVQLDAPCENTEPNRDMVNNGDDKQWCLRYLKINTVDPRSHAASSDYRDANAQCKSASQDEIVSRVVPEMRRRVEAVVDMVKSYLMSNNGKLDPNLMMDILLAVNDVTVKMETMCLARFKINVEFDAKDFASDICIHLRKLAIQELYAAEERQYCEEMEFLKQTKREWKLNFSAVVGYNTNDVDQAKMFAEAYDRLLHTWVKSKVIEFTSQARDQVLRAMPDPEKALRIAYKTSFEEGNYERVLEYCLDVHAYLNRLFSEIFDSHMQTAIDQSKASLADDVSAVYRLLEQSADQWQKRLGSTTKDIHLFDFKEYLQQRAFESSQDPAVVSQRELLQTNFPVIVNFCIARVDTFTVLFRKNVLELLSRAIKSLDDQIAERARHERYEVWAKLRGCAAKCQFCGSTCSLRNGHGIDHNLTVHILPAFRGFREFKTRSAVLITCHHAQDLTSTSKEYSDSLLYPTVPRCMSYAATLIMCIYNPRFHQLTGLKPKHVPTEQIQAWMNCKDALLAYWNMVDRTPEEWSVYESCSHTCMTERDIESALERLRPFQRIPRH